jgi:hypothetical protein
VVVVVVSCGQMYSRTSELGLWSGAAGRAKMMSGRRPRCRIIEEDAVIELLEMPWVVQYGRVKEGGVRKVI